MLLEQVLMFAQEIAISKPENVQKLILYSTGSIGALPGRFETIDESKSRITNEGAEIAAERISATWFKELTDSPFHHACADLAKRANLKTMFYGLGAMKSWNRHNDLGRIKSETLIIWGTEDRTYNREQIDLLHDRIKNSQLHIIPDTAHAIHDEKSIELAEILNLYVP
jgi:2-hydroxy-6-oxonona-2,4-dienedioate hydrolase